MDTHTEQEQQPCSDQASIPSQDTCSAGCVDPALTAETVSPLAMVPTPRTPPPPRGTVDSEEAERELRDRVDYECAAGPESCAPCGGAPSPDSP